MPVEYSPGALYLFLNPTTRQGAYFEPFEVLEYGGHKIAYGEVRRDHIRTWRGVRETPERATALPVPARLYDPVGVAALAFCIRSTGGDQGTGRLLGNWRIARLGPDETYQTMAAKGFDPTATWEPVYNYSLEWLDWLERGARTRDAFVRAAQYMLRLYDAILRDYEGGGPGRLPSWFLDERRRLWAANAARNPSVALGLTTPDRKPRFLMAETLRDDAAASEKKEGNSE